MKKLPKHYPTKKNKALILTIASCVGVLGTGVSTFIATRKSEKILNDEKLSKKEKIIKSSKHFITPVSIGLGSIICCASANYLNRKQIKSLIGSLSIANSTFLNYRKQVIDKYGEDIDKEIFYSVRKDCDYHVWDVDTPDKLIRWHDWATDTWFEKYEREVADAEYHLNRNYVFASIASVNDWANFLGIGQQPVWDTIGWSTTFGEGWIDFEHVKMEDEHGEFYEIVPIFGPQEIRDEIGDFI